MASTNRTFAFFTITQPFLGAPLQFQPALGSPELEQMIDAFVTGSASKKDKLSEVTIDFYNYATVDINTGALVRRYDVALPVSSPWDFDLSPTLSQSSGFGSSIYTPSPASSTTFADSGYGSISMTPPTRTRGARVSKKPKKETKKTTEVRLPGFSIMTKDGVDVTSTAGRGTKTKEQREHAHLMRIMKACDDCKRKKIRCDPSHRRSHDMSRTSTSTTTSATRSDPSPSVSVPSLSQEISFSEDTFGTNAIDDFVLFPEDNTYWNPADMSMPEYDQNADWSNFNYDMSDIALNDFSTPSQVFDQSFNFSSQNTDWSQVNCDLNGISPNDLSTSSLYLDQSPITLDQSPILDQSLTHDQSFDFFTYEPPFASPPGFSPLVIDQQDLDPQLVNRPLLTDQLIRSPQAANRPVGNDRNSLNSQSANNLLVVDQQDLNSQYVNSSLVIDHNIATSQSGYSSLVISQDDIASQQGHNSLVTDHQNLESKRDCRQITKSHSSLDSAPDDISLATDRNNLHSEPLYVPGLSDQEGLDQWTTSSSSLSSRSAATAGITMVMPYILLAAVLSLQFSLINTVLVTGFAILTMSLMHGIEQLQESVSQWVGIDSFTTLAKILLCCALIVQPPYALLGKMDGLRSLATVVSVVQCLSSASGVMSSTHKSVSKNFGKNDVLGFLEILTDTVRAV